MECSALYSVWYAGAYTVQTNTVPLDTGRKVPFAPAGSKWNYYRDLDNSGSFSCAPKLGQTMLI